MGLVRARIVCALQPSRRDTAVARRRSARTATRERQRQRTHLSQNEDLTSGPHLLYFPYNKKLVMLDAREGVFCWKSL